ncbi:hypothetical protein [Actibacterium sp. D379-3]
MNEPPTTRTPLTIWIALALWAGAFTYSFWIFQTTQPLGDGFTRGMNRITGFLGWQVLSTVLALMVFGLGRRLPAGPQRRMSALPLVLAGLLAAGIAALMLWAALAHP